jgi:CRP/FNR family transcriptional regulator, anaerobic regulatory protein
MSGEAGPAWTESLPSLSGLDEETKATLRRNAVCVIIPQGRTIFRPGDCSSQFPLVLSGSIRVQRVTESGREIVLYRVQQNETCILTIAGLLASEIYEAEAITETEVVAYLLSARVFKDLMDRSSSFRALVFEGYSRRLMMLMSKIEQILCTRIDVRLAQGLLSMMNADKRIETTQQALAVDLGTAREVVGRALLTFQRSGWVKLSRGVIKVLNSEALLALSENK